MKPPCQQEQEQLSATLKPLSQKEKLFAQKHSIFLLRNLQKLKQIRSQPTKTTFMQQLDQEPLRETILNKQGNLI